MDALLILFAVGKTAQQVFAGTVRDVFVQPGVTSFLTDEEVDIVFRQHERGLAEEENLSLLQFGAVMPRARRDIDTVGPATRQVLADFNP